MILFYQPDIIPDNPNHILDEEESKHAIRVMRLKNGDRVFMTNGKGLLAEGVIADARAKKCLVAIESFQQSAARAPYAVHVAIAPTKNIGRFEWFLEKATEIGIDTITPVFTRNSERKIIKTDRLQKVLVAAMKQSLKSFLPVLNEPLNFKEFIRSPLGSNNFIAYVSEAHRRRLDSLYPPGEDTTILIGPEGDFDAREIEDAIAHGFQAVSLGNSRLRTETAGIVACHTIALKNGS